MTHLNQIQLFRKRVDLCGFIFPPAHGQDWTAHMQACQDRAARVCIFEVAHAMMALLDTYPIDAIEPKWNADGRMLDMAITLHYEGKADRYPVSKTPFSINFLDKVDQNHAWKEAMSVFDRTRQASLFRCARQLNEAFPQPMNYKQLTKVIGEHAADVEVLWQEVALDHETPRAKGTQKPSRI